MLAGIFSLYIAGWSLRNAHLIPPPDAPMTFAEKLRESKNLIPVVLLIVVPSRLDLRRHRHRHRGAALGVLGSLVISAAQGSMNWTTFKESLMGGDAPVLHDRADPRRRLVPHAEHGLHRPAAPPRRVDRDAAA